ncbi:pyruvate,water dikinase [Georgenia soli]|uniref:Phosphoenolpyruvate synthase n=1 Tax=Georgenia soli TaxID=638953 RepID=A0A2A9ERF8_9MICO|nr:PEP/pyruvate-binding domain-containing protein [Georgenia soli]PFG41111.1 pyruvate,water dikinase [Georgenia soli]
MTEPLVLPFTDPRAREVALSGGKGASLATMTSEGLPVPPGFIITSAAFSAAVDEDALRERARAKDMAGARSIVAAARPPVELVTEQYNDLTGLVAVRSSACAEDSEGASYAGQQETFLNVDGLDTVLDKVVECWLSFFTDRAVFYREEKGSLEDVAMAVVVQQMVDSKKSGVMFTVDPVHQRKDRMVVEAALGLGENVVNGEMTPDHYVLDRKGTIKRSKIVSEPVLGPEESAELAAMGQQLENLHGCPQDIEWAIDDNGVLFLLQSRPITTV